MTLINIINKISKNIDLLKAFFKNNKKPILPIVASILIIIFLSTLVYAYSDYLLMLMSKINEAYVRHASYLSFPVDGDPELRKQLNAIIKEKRGPDNLDVEARKKVAKVWIIGFICLDLLNIVLYGSIGILTYRDQNK